MRQQFSNSVNKNEQFAIYSFCCIYMYTVLVEKGKSFEIYIFFAFLFFLPNIRTKYEYNFWTVMNLLTVNFFLYNSTVNDEVKGTT